MTTEAREWFDSCDDNRFLKPGAPVCRCGHQGRRWHWWISQAMTDPPGCKVKDCDCSRYRPAKRKQKRS